MTSEVIDRLSESFQIDYQHMVCVTDLQQVKALLLLLFTFTAVLLMSLWCVHGLRVDVFPRRPLLRLGERHQLVCRVQDCPTMPSVSWSLLEDRPLTAAVRTNGTQSVVTFDPVMMEHEGALLCRASCGGGVRQVKSSVRVYCESTHKHTVTQGELGVVGGG